MLLWLLNSLILSKLKKSENGYDNKAEATLNSICNCTSCGAVALFSIELIKSNIVEIIERENPKLRAILEMEINIKEASEEILKILNRRDTIESLDENFLYQDAVSEYRHYRSEYIQRVRTKKEQEIFKEIDKKFNEFISLGERLFYLHNMELKKLKAKIEQSETIKLESKKQEVFENYLRVSRELDILFDEKIQPIDMLLILEDENNTKNVIQYVFVGIVISMFLTLIIGLYLGKEIHKPIEKLIYASKEFANKNLTYKIELKEDGEFSLLSNALNKMAIELHHSQEKLKYLNRNLKEQVNEEIKKNREKENLLIQQSKMASMGEMIGVIAHQWKQPLNVIVMQAYLIEVLIEDDNFDKEELKSIQNAIENQIDFMSQTIDDFRNFYRPDKRKEPFQPCESFFKVKEMFEGSFEKSNILVTVHEHEHFTSLGYPNEFMQVALNILNNAKDVIVERGIKDGKIDCYISNDDEFGVIRIQDNGGGIPQELLPDRLFEAYISTKESDKGTGIGLEISKTIIEQNLHGRLSAHNIETGAEFMIELPILKEEKSPIS